MKKLSILLSVTVLAFTSCHEIRNASSVELHKGGQEEEHGVGGMYAYFNMLKANQNTGVVDIADVSAARAAVANLLAQKSGNSLGLVWEEKGPINIGGRTRAILVDRNNPQRIFAGAVTGGIWISNDGGATWGKYDDQMGTLSISCMAQASNGDIYVGTGEAFYPNPSGDGNSAFWGQGMYKSTDGGATFLPIASTWDANNTTLQNIWKAVFRVAVDPNNPNRVYAATQRGLQMSDNGGQTWTNPVKINNSPQQAQATDVKVNSAGNVVVSVGNKCFTSPTGNDNTFTLRSGSQSTQLPSTGVGRIEFAVAPSDPNTLYCLAATTTSIGTLKGVYRSSDFGTTWEVLITGGSDYFEPFQAGPDADQAQGQYDNTIAVFPADKNHILLGGVDVYSWFEGGNWQQRSLWNAFPFGQYYLHADQHNITFSPQVPNLVYFGNDGGLFKSQDGGQSFSNMNKGYATTQAYSVAFSRDDKVMIGCQDNGTIYVNEQFGPKVGIPVGGGDGGYCDFSMMVPNIQFNSVYYGAIERSANGGLSSSGFKSNAMSAITGSFITPCRLWESFYDPLANDSVRYVADQNLSAGTVISAVSNTSSQLSVYDTLTAPLAQGDTVWIKNYMQAKYALGLTGSVWVTEQALDFSKTPDWFKVANISGTVQTMEFSKDGRYLYVGTQAGRVYRINDLSKIKDSLNSFVGAPNYELNVSQIFVNGSRPVTSIAVDPNDPDRVVVTFGNYGNNDYVFFSSNATDSLPTFTTRQGNLPEMPVYASVIDMQAGSKVILGTEFGIFSTTNINAANPVWVAETDGFPNVPVMMLRQQTQQWAGVLNSGYIYAGTHGRGAFRTSTLNAPLAVNNLPALNTTAVSVYPNPARESATVSYSVNKTSNLVINFFDIKGQLMKRVEQSGITPGVHTLPVNTSTWPAGTYFVTISADKQVGYQKFIVVGNN